VSREKSSAKEIETFVIAGAVSAEIGETAPTVSIVMPATANLTSLVPTITVSEGASVSPASGVAQNFSAPVAYTVTAEDGSTKVWTVTVTKAAPLGNSDTEFSKSIEVYPVPVRSGSVSVKLPERGTWSVTLLDAKGQLISTQQTTESLLSIDFEKLPAGAYFLRLRLGEKEAVKKVIKE
jgi:hypothetical protein